MRQRTLIPLCVLAGAAVNYPISWAIVWRRNPEKVTRSVRATERGDTGLAWPCPVPAGWPEPNWDARYRTLGDRITDVRARDLASSELPRPATHAAFVHRAGWPALGLRYTSLWDGRETMTGAVRLRHPIGYSVFLPVAPAWPGFAVNTAVYGSGAWLLATLPGMAHRRRRVRRGLCPSCAFPVGHSALCTECGGPLHARAATAGASP